jgi:hypothetical protein
MTLSAYARLLDKFLEVAARTDKQRAIAAQVAKLERALKPAFDRQARVFLAGFTKLRSQWRVQESIGASDLDPLFTASDVASMELFREPIQAAAAAMLASGAKSLIAQLGVSYSFTLKNPRAVEYLKEHGAAMVKKIDDTTRADIQHIVTYGMENGWSYSQTALAIQRQYKGYYDTGSWWNFDAARPQGHIDSRAHLIAITESGNAYEEGNYIVAQDLAAAGLEMEKYWSTMNDDRVSDGCAENEGAGWIPESEAFPSGDMHPLRFPGCLPGGQRVVVDGLLGAMKRFYNGRVVVVTTTSGNKLTCTPNHPILTPCGWVGAERLNVGGYVVCAGGAQGAQPAPDMNKQHRPTPIEKVVASFGGALHVAPEVVKVSPPHFHGDGEGSQVAIVWSDGLLRSGVYPAFEQHIVKNNFAWANIGRHFFSCRSHFATLTKRMLSSARCVVGGLAVSRVFLGRSALHHDFVGIGNTAQGNTPLNQAVADNAPINPEKLANRNGGFAGCVSRDDGIHWDSDLALSSSAPISAPGDTNRNQAAGHDSLTNPELVRQRLLSTSVEIFADQVISIDTRNFCGHVYNLQTQYGFYVAEGIITHNCRCDCLYQVKGA